MKSILRRLTNRLHRNSDSPNKTKNVELENLESRLLFSAAPVEAPTEEVESEAPAADVQVDTQSAQAAADAVTESSAESEAAPLPTGGESSVSPSQGVQLLEIDDTSGQLNQETLDAVAEAAAERWRATGLTADQSAALDAIDYNVDNLSNFQLGVADGNLITLDDDAGGRGWFIDGTPLLDEEYTLGDNGILATNLGEAGYGQDLLTVLMHEQGHILGIDDHAANLDPSDIMTSTLSAGQRRLPALGQAEGHDPGLLEGAHFIVPTLGTPDSVAADLADTISNFTVGMGDDRLLVVFAFEEFDDTIDDVTYDLDGAGGAAPVSLTNLGGSFGSVFVRMEVWYMTLGDGVAITGDVVMTAHAGADGQTSVVAAVAYEGVNQLTPVDPLVTSTAASLSTTVTSEVGDLVVGAAYHNAVSALGAGTAQTAIHTHNDPIGGGYGAFISSQEAGAASVTMDYTGAGSGTDTVSMAFNINALVAGAAEPAISIEHQPTATLIADGDTTPSGNATTGEGTRFGSVDTASGSETRTFVIRNSGAGDLILPASPVSLAGADMSHFTVTQPGSLLLTTGQSTTFDVIFNPTADGLHDDVTVHVANNDPQAAEADYDFAVEGIGTTTAPATNITQLGTAESTSNDGAGAGTLTTTTLPFTVEAGTNRLLVVFGHEEEAAAASQLTGVTFQSTGGSPVTLPLTNLLLGGEAVDSGGGQQTEIYYLALGSGGQITGNIVMSTSDSFSDNDATILTAVAYENVDQTTPVDGFNSTNGGAAGSDSSLNIVSEAGDRVVTVHANQSINGATADPTADAAQTVIHDLNAIQTHAYLLTSTETGSLVVDSLHSWNSAPSAGQAYVTAGLNINAAPPNPDIDWDDNTANVPAGATVTVEDAGTPANNDAGAANTIAFQDRVVNHNNTASSTLDIDLQAVGTPDSFSLAAGGANSASVTFSPGSGGPISAPTAATITGLGFDASIDDTAGAKSATVTSTDGNTAAADDIDDVLNLSTNVFDPANASFSAGSDLNTTTIDFGTQAADSGTYTDTWAITNREGLNNFTLDLDFVSIADDGDSGPFNANSLALALFGDQQEDITSSNYTALFDTTGLAAGVYTENFTLTFATDDASEGDDVLGVGGLSTQALTLTLTAVVTGGAPPATEESGVSISGTDLVITDVLGGNTDDDLTISTTATTLTIVDNNGNGIDLGAVTGTGDGTDTVTIALGASGCTGGIVWDALGGDDILRIDFSSGDFSRAITFDGGANGGLGDELFLFGGGTFDAAWYNFTNENDGNITLIQNATISYTGLEPITSTLTVTNANLIYSGVDETIAVSAAGVGTTRVDSTAGEAVTFANPTGALNIYAGDGNDTINVNGFGTGFGAALTIDGQAGSDLINYRADGVTLGAGNSATFDAERIDFLLGDLTTTSGNIIARGTGATSGSSIGVRLIGTDLETGSGDITLAGQGGTTGINNQGVQISGSSSLLTGGGNIEIDGTGGGTTVANHGVAIYSGSSLSTGTSGSGSITIDGTGGTLGTSLNHGVYLTSGTSATSHDGSLRITGTGAGSAGLNHGFDALGATITNTGTGGIHIEGSSSSSGGSNNQGAVLVNSTVSTTPAAGVSSITLIGSGSSSGLSSNEGVKLSNTDVTANSSSVNIDGFGGGTGAGTNNTGVFFSGGSTATASTMTIDGIAGSGSLFNRGVFVTGGSLISASTSLAVNGTGGGSATYNRGIEIVSSTVTGTGSGTLSLTGTGSTTSTGLFNTGVLLQSSTAGSGSGNVTITGNGGTGSSYNEGVRIYSSSVTTTGTTDIRGIAHGGTTGSSNAGVYIFLNSTVNGDASSTIAGTGAGGALGGLNHGVFMSVGITSNFGTLFGSITGLAGNGATSLDRAGDFPFPPPF